MNNKVAIGLVAALIVLALAFVVLHKQAAPPAFTETATTTSVTGTTTATPTIVTPAPTTVPAVTTSLPKASKPTLEVLSTTQKPDTTTITFDTPKLLTNDGRPTMTGTASTKTISVVIVNRENVGISGSWDIAVINGHWSYTPAITLTPGTYTIQVAGGSKTVNGTVTVMQ